MSRAKRCNSQDIFLTKETKESRLSEPGWGSGRRDEEDHYGPPRGTQSYGGNGMRAWEDEYSSFSKGKGKSWEEAFAAGYAMAASKGWGKASYGSWDSQVDRRGGKDRSRSPTGFWSSGGGGGKSGGKYANFGSPGGKSGGKNGDGWKGKGKGNRKGKGNSKGKRDDEDEEVPDASMLDADLDKYFGKETTASAPGANKSKGSGKDSNVNAGELDSQLNDYFGNDKKPEAEAERKATAEEEKGTTAAGGEASEVPKPAAEEAAAVETKS